MSKLPELTAEELERYEWQIATPGFGEIGQRRLKGATVLVSRIGGVGGTVAMQLAAAGVGRLILAHGGNLRRNDLNRQLLMQTADIGQPRIDSARARLHALNPHVAVETIGENIHAANAAQLVAQCDVVVSAAPLFSERLSMNQAAVQMGKPLVDCAMYDLEARLTVVQPGISACLACLYPEEPPHWQRQFPVFGAVASTIGALAAMEVIKFIAALGESLAGRMLVVDQRTLSFQSITLARRADCQVCASP
jgi:molybdopterin/thiamine biosynthesis adenylyltransferase